MANRTNLNGHRLRLPSTRTAFYLSPLVLVVALMLVAILAVPAVAQDATPTPGTVIWSATLTVDEDGVYLGCDDGFGTSMDNCSSALTDDDFEYNGVTYQVEELFYASDTNRTFLGTEPASQSRLVGLELHLGTTKVTLGASIPGRHRWENVNPQWSVGQKVAVKLATPPIAPTDERCPNGWLSVSSTSSTTNSITVNWNAQRLANDAQITAYQVWYRDTDLVRHQKGETLSPDARSWTIPGLTSGKRYLVWLVYQTGGQWLDCGYAHGPISTELIPTPTPTPAPTPTPTPTPLPSFKAFPVQFELNRYYINENDGRGITVRWRCHPKLTDEQCASANVQIYIASSEEDWNAGDAKHGELQRATYDYDYEFRSNWQGAPSREWVSGKINVRNDNYSAARHGGTEPTERFYVVAQYKPDCYTAECKKYVAVDIEDASSAFMMFYHREVTAKEEDRSVTLQIRCSTQVCSERDHSFTIETSNKVRKEAAKVKIVGGDLPHATVGVDYEKTTFTRTIAKGVGYIDITLSISDDDKSEPDEMMFAKLTVNGVENVEPRYAFVTIKDGDTAALIGFSPTHYTRSEGTDSYVDLTIVRAGGPVSMPVQFTVSATDANMERYNREFDTHKITSIASQDLDYKSGKYKGRLGPGENSATVRIPLIDNNIGEAVERFIGYLTVDSAGGEVTDANEALISIRDNDEVLLKASPAYCQLVEQGKKKEGQCKLSISLDTQPDDSMYFSVTSSDTSAVTVDKSELTFTKDNWNKPQKVTIKAIDDHDYESELVKVVVKATLTSGILFEQILEIPILVQDNDLKYLKDNEYTFIPTISAYGTDPQVQMMLGGPAESEISYYVTVKDYPYPQWNNIIKQGATKPDGSVAWDAPSIPESMAYFTLIEYKLLVTGMPEGYTQVGPATYYQVVMPPEGGL